MRGLFNFKRKPSYSFEQVFKAHHRFVYRLSVNLCGNKAEAEDITQEVFIAVHNGLSQFEGNSQLRTWIYRITVRVAGRHLSKLKHHDTLEQAQTITSDCNLERDIAKAQLLKAIGKLPLPQRTILCLSLIEGLSQKEVAEVLAIPVGTVGSRLHTAKQNLTGYLQQP